MFSFWSIVHHPTFLVYSVFVISRLVPLSLSLESLYILVTVGGSSRSNCLHAYILILLFFMAAISGLHCTIHHWVVKFFVKSCININQSINSREKESFITCRTSIFEEVIKQLTKKKSVKAKQKIESKKTPDQKPFSIRQVLKNRYDCWNQMIRLRLVAVQNPTAFWWGHPAEYTGLRETRLLYDRTN